MAVPVTAAPPRREASVAETLGLDVPSASRSRLARRVLRWGIPVAAVAAAIIAVLVWRRAEPVAYDTSAARRGDLIVTVTATGTLTPLDTVYVGTEVSGIIDTVAVDYNDHVRKGQLLAVVNTEQLRAQIVQAEASLRSVRANAQQAAATLEEVRLQAMRAETLAAANVLTRQELEGARASLARATAADAAARAQIAAAEAGLSSQRTALRKATIRAPISGIVLQRQVEPGRTVTAAFQTPTLFVLAADLAHMTLGLDIDEADVGLVTAGQVAEFTVDAFPERTFRATVRSVRNAAKTVEGVVTYQAILDVANADLALRPGMTATARITTARVDDALLVPNAALRFTPASDSATTPAPSRPASGANRTAPAQRVWVLRDGRPVAQPVTVGLSNGQWTAVTATAIVPGTPLIVGLLGAEETTATTTSRRGGPPGMFPGPIRAR